MSLSTCSIAGLNLLVTPYTVEAFDLPDASVSELGRAAQLAGAVPCRSHYDDPTWALTIIVRSSVATDVSVLHTKFRAGAALVFGEGATPRTTRLRTVEATTTANYSSWSRVTFSGLRAPEWEGAPVDLGTLTVTDGWGTADAPAVGGEIAAKVLLYARSTAASTGLHIGVRPEPQALYTPLDDYSGGADPTAIGGAWSADLAQTSTPQRIAVAPDRDIGANRGSHLAVARVRHSSSTTAAQSFDARSVLFDKQRIAPFIHPSVANGTLADSVEVLGSLAVPAVPIPLGVASAASGFSNVAGGVSYANGTLQNPAYFATSDGRYYAEYYQTFTLPMRARISAIQLTGTGTWWTGITRAAGGVPTGSNLTSGTSVTANGAFTVPMDLVLDAGTYAVCVDSNAGTLSEMQAATLKMEIPGAYAGGIGGYRNSGLTYTQGYNSQALDLAFSVTWYPAIVSNFTMPVQAWSTETAKNAAVDALMRVPTDFSAVSVTTPITAGAGVLYDPESRTVYPCNSSAQLSDVSLMGQADLLGAAHGIALAPNVANRFVVANGAKSTVTLTGTATPCYLRRA